MNGSSFQFNWTYDGSTDSSYNITSTQSELAHLYYVTLGNSAAYDAAGNYQFSGGLSNTGPFSNVQSDVYWSIVFDNGNVDYSWLFNTANGFQNFIFNKYAFSAWAVHSGDVGAAVTSVPEPETYALALAGLAAATLLARKRRA